MATKTVTATFRIEEEAFRDLQEDARRQNVSVNTLVNQMFLAYSHYDRLMKRFHVIKDPIKNLQDHLGGVLGRGCDSLGQDRRREHRQDLRDSKVRVVHHREHPGRL